MGKNEKEPKQDPITDPVFQVQVIDPNSLKIVDMRRIIAEAIFSTKSQTNIFFQFPDYSDIVDSKQLRTIARKSIEEINQFIDEKVNDICYSVETTITSQKNIPK